MAMGTQDTPEAEGGGLTPNSPSAFDFGSYGGPDLCVGRAKAKGDYTHDEGEAVEDEGTEKDNNEKMK